MGCSSFIGGQQVSMCETVKAAVLDSACTKTVTGRAWRGTYLESLSNEERSQIKILPGGTVFRFGGEMKKECSEILILPCTVAGRKVMIQIDVVDSDIPLLSSKPDMKRLGLQINMENDTAKIFDKVIDLQWRHEVKLLSLSAFCEKRCGIILCGSKMPSFSRVYTRYQLMY